MANPRRRRQKPEGQLQCPTGTRGQDEIRKGDLERGRPTGIRSKERKP